MPSQDRRAAHRHRVTFRLVCDDGTGFTIGTVLDISSSGILVQTHDSRDPGTEMSLTPVGLAGEILFDMRATVVRVLEVDEGARDKCYRLGLRFKRVDRKRLAALYRLFREMPSTDLAFEDVPGRPAVDDTPSQGGEAHHRIRLMHDAPTKPPSYLKRPF